MSEQEAPREAPVAAAPIARLLLVEDDPDYQQLLEFVLHKAGYQLVFASDATSGLRAVAETSPDVILLDYRLPDMTGIEFCQRLRRQDELPPVVMLSGHGSLDISREAVRIGINDFVDKSASTDLLLVRLQAALRTRRLAELARSRNEAMAFLSDVTARFNRSLELEEVLESAAQSAARFAPARMMVLDLTEDEPPTLRVFSASRPQHDDPRVTSMLARARSAMSVHVEPAEIRIKHRPMDWPKPGGHALVGHAPSTSRSPRTFVAIEPSRPLSDEEKVLFADFVERLASPLQNAHLYASKQKANEELSEAFRQLARAQAERVAAEKLAGIGQLAAGVAHEINNPLAFVVSNLSVLSQYVRELKLLLDLYRTERYEEAERMVERIDPETLVRDLLPLIDETLEGSNRVQNIVRKLRGFTSVQGEDRITELNVQAVVESVLNIMHGELRRHVFVKREFEAVPKVRGDRSKLSQVFLNLLTNASNAIPRDSDGRIIVRLFAEGSDVAIQFEDNGRGIPKDRLARVLEPFEAVEDIAVGGLDLAIADEIVRRHGGRIDVDSEEDTGSTFTVWLPARSTVPLPMIVETSPPDEPQGGALFIDDERFLLNAYRRAFSRRVRVHIAHGGEEGIKLLDELDDIDVVFCDLVMPRVSGIEVYAWVAANRPELLERFVVITGGQHGERNREFLERTMLPVVHKPFRVKEVVDMINRFTGRSVRYQ